jgi:hypothetical protein
MGHEELSGGDLPLGQSLEVRCEEREVGPLTRKDPNDDMKSLWARTDERLKAMKVRLREVSAEFKHAVDRKAPSKSPAAAKIDELLSDHNWSRVHPGGLWASQVAPWDVNAVRIAFDPSEWPEVDGTALLRAIEDCHRAFVDHERTYRIACGKLSAEGLRELFPDGRPKP